MPKPQTFKRGHKTSDEIRWGWFQEALDADWDSLCLETKTWRIEMEQKHQCALCNATHWKPLSFGALQLPGSKMTFYLQAKNGNYEDWSRENLYVVCFTCYADSFLVK